VTVNLKGNVGAASWQANGGAGGLGGAVRKTLQLALADREAWQQLDSQLHYYLNSVSLV
jgi:hypothetical protein